MKLVSAREKTYFPEPGGTMDVGLWGTVGEGRPVGPVKVLDCRDVESVVEIRKDTNRATHLGNFVNMFILKGVGGKSTASPGGEEIKS